MSGPCTVAAPKDDKHWMSKHLEYVEAVKNSDCDVVFIGDSIIEYMETSCIWHDIKTLCRCVNLGIGGDRVENVLWRVQNGEMDFVNPVKVVVLLVGTNNVNNEPEDIFEGLMEIIKEIKTRLGNVTIILPSLLPKGQYPNPFRTKNENVNKMLEEKFCTEDKTEETENVYYVSIGQHLLEPDGTISDKHLYDYLHLTDIAYLKSFGIVLQKMKELDLT